MAKDKKPQSYRFIIILWCAILLGALTGLFLGPKALHLKPLGDIFLNLLFTFVVPLVFFSISSAIASIGDSKKVGVLAFNMLAIFFVSSLIAAVLMLVVVRIFPPAQGVVLNLAITTSIVPFNFSEQMVSIFTVSDFIKLFSRENMLALILFSALVGLATAGAGDQGKRFAAFLEAGTAIFMKALNLVMYYAPIGFFAYFAVLVAELGPALLQTYYRATLAYYIAASFYFVFGLSFYAYLAGGTEAIKRFWRELPLPALTALATCSSAASIPANLEATKRMKVSSRIYELVVPLGGIIHKDGSVLGGILKIAFLFGLFNMNFSTPAVIGLALLMAMLVGTVMGAIPSGGMIGEMLILSVYGFPPQTLMAIAAISLIIDPPATVINVVGNSVASMLLARLVEGKKWLTKPTLP